MKSSSVSSSNRAKSRRRNLDYALLEERRVLTANLPVNTFIDADNTLVISADPASTETVVRITDSFPSASAIEIHNCEIASGDVACSSSTEFDVADFTSLRYVGNDFVDDVRINVSFGFNVLLLGNGGDDDLRQGVVAGEVVIFGGPGDDTLVGDRLTGNAGDDLLIGNDRDNFLRGDN